MSDKKPFRFSLQSFNTESPRSWRNLISKTEGCRHPGDTAAYHKGFIIH